MATIWSKPEYTTVKGNRHNQEGESTNMRTTTHVVAYPQSIELYKNHAFMFCYICIKMA